MKKLLLVAVMLLASSCAHAVCRPSGVPPLNLGIPDLMDSGTSWAQCIRLDLITLSSAATTPSTNTWTGDQFMNRLYVNEIGGRTADIKFSSQTTFESSVTVETDMLVNSSITARGTSGVYVLGAGLASFANVGLYVRNASLNYDIIASSPNGSVRFFVDKQGHVVVGTAGVSYDQAFVVTGDATITAGLTVLGSSISATAFYGSGAGLTNVPDSALTSNVALLNRTNQTFTGVNTHTSSFTIRNSLQAGTSTLYVVQGVAGGSPLGVGIGGLPTAGIELWVDGDGYFSRTVQADTGFFGNLTGNAQTATALAANPTACGAGEFVNDIAANGTLTCGTPAGSGDVTTNTNQTISAVKLFSHATSGIESTGASIKTIRGYGADGTTLSSATTYTSSATFTALPTSILASSQIVSSAGVSSFWDTKVTNFSQVIVHSGNGHGSTNTKIRRFTTSIAEGSDITYADSGTLGGSFTVNTTGVYDISYNDYKTTTAEFFAVTVNDSVPTANGSSMTYAEGKRCAGSAATALVQHMGCSLKLTAGDVIRAHTDGSANNTDANTMFIVTRVR